LICYNDHQQYDVAVAAAVVYVVVSYRLSVDRDVVAAALVCLMTRKVVVVLGGLFVAAVVVDDVDVRMR
jgi:hypothetical protein